MTKTSPPPDPAVDQTGDPSPGDSSPILSSRDLLAGHREVIIQHGTEQYRLRLTRNDRLILVK